MIKTILPEGKAKKLPLRAGVWAGYPEGMVLRPTPFELETLRSQIERCRELHKEQFHNEDYPYWDDSTIAEYLGE